MSDQQIAEGLDSWLGRIAANEMPPGSVIAYNIGLLQTEDGYSAYLIGANEFDPDDADWACNETFTPNERYFPLPCTASLDWKAVHTTVANAVRVFLLSANGKASFFAKAEAVTVGFDDGELERIA